MNPRAVFRISSYIFTMSGLLVIIFQFNKPDRTAARQEWIEAILYGCNMQDMTDSRMDGCKTPRMDARQDGCQTGWMPDRMDAR